MSDDIKAKFERLPINHRDIMIEAAYGQDPVWNHISRLYGFDGPDRFWLRDMIRRTYRENGQRILPSPSKA